LLNSIENSISRLEPTEGRFHQNLPKSTRIRRRIEWPSIARIEDPRTLLKLIKKSPTVGCGSDIVLNILFFKNAFQINSPVAAAEQMQRLRDLDYGTAD
jgi:hypothetical protein